MSDYSRADGSAEPVAILGVGGTVFVFPGDGSRWTRSAVELMDSAPAFADEMRRCDAAFTEFVDWSLLDAVRAGTDSLSLDRVDVLQPVLFAVMVSLAAQWRARGIHPDAVVGHSHGEVAAAYVAGGLSLQDAAKVVALRSRAIMRNRRNRWHGLDPVARRTGTRARRTVASIDFCCRAGWAVVDRHHRVCGGVGRAHGPMRAGRTCLPRGSLSVTPPIRRRSNRCERHFAKHFPGCNREPAISRSSPG